MSRRSILAAGDRGNARSSMPDGRIVARTDLGIPSAKLGLGGSTADASTSVRSMVVSTKSATSPSVACGWELLYLGWHATKRPAEVLQLVRQVVATRNCELSVRISAR